MDLTYLNHCMKRRNKKASIIDTQIWLRYRTINESSLLYWYKNSISAIVTNKITNIAYWITIVPIYVTFSGMCPEVLCRRSVLLTKLSSIVSITKARATNKTNNDMWKSSGVPRLVP